MTGFQQESQGHDKDLDTTYKYNNISININNMKQKKKKQKNSPRAQTTCLMLFGPVLVIPNLHPPSCISPKAWVLEMMAVGCQAVVVAVVLENRVKEGDLLEEHVNLRTQLQEWMLAVYIW